jgi:hypothetical protein
MRAMLPNIRNALGTTTNRTSKSNASLWNKHKRKASAAAHKVNKKKRK